MTNSCCYLAISWVYSTVFTQKSASEMFYFSSTELEFGFSSALAAALLRGWILGTIGSITLYNMLELPPIFLSFSKSNSPKLIEAIKAKGRRQHQAGWHCPCPSNFDLITSAAANGIKVYSRIVGQDSFPGVPPGPFALHIYFLSISSKKA